MRVSVEVFSVPNFGNVGLGVHGTLQLIITDILVMNGESSTCDRPAWSCSIVSSYWLSFPQRVTFKLCLLTYKCLHARTGTRLSVELLRVTDLRSWPSSDTFIWRKQTAGTTVLHDQLWTAFLRFFWSDCLEWHTGSSAQPGLTSKWL